MWVASLGAIANRVSTTPLDKHCNSKPVISDQHGGLGCDRQDCQLIQPIQLCSAMPLGTGILRVKGKL